MKVSVAMATYNGGPYLGAQLASLLCQDRLPDELVISDDGSCDETELVVAEFAATAPFPVIWLRNPGRRGYQHNFDFALAATIGDVLLLADQDDVWLEQHISRLVTPFETSRQLMVTAGDSRVMDARGDLAPSTLRMDHGMPPSRVRATNEAAGAAQFRQVLGRRAVVGHCLAMRRVVLEVASPLPPSWMYDEWIFLVGAAMGRVLYVDDVVSQYRQYAREVPGPEYQRAPEAVSALALTSALAARSTSGFGSVRSPAAAGRVSARASSMRELAKWQNLLSRLSYAAPMLPAAERAVQDVDAHLRLIAFRATLRKQSAPVRAVRILPRLLTGRYHRADPI